MTKIPSDDILESLYKQRTRESEKLKTVLELYDLEIHQKKIAPDYHRLKTMVKRSFEQNLRMKNSEARSGNSERNAVIENLRSWDNNHLNVDHLMHGNWVVVFQDMTPPKFILRKSSDLQKPIQRVKVTNVTQKFETKIFRSDKFCPGEAHQRSPNAPKFEDRSQEETEWQEQGAREASVEAGQKCFF